MKGRRKMRSLNQQTKEEKSLGHDHSLFSLFLDMKINIFSFFFSISSFFRRRNFPLYSSPFFFPPFNQEKKKKMKREREKKEMKKETVIRNEIYISSLFLITPSLPFSGKQTWYNSCLGIRNFSSSLSLSSQSLSLSLNDSLREKEWERLFQPLLRWCEKFSS